MPTNRRRHTITETEQVEEALRPLREQGIPVDFAALIIRGAQTTLADRQHEVEDAGRRRELRAAFFDHGAERFDLEAALVLRARGWASA